MGLGSVCGLLWPSTETRKEKEARAGGHPAGPWPMQLRYQTGLTREQYVSDGWRLSVSA